MPYIKKGDVFNRLVALSDSEKSYNKILFQCDCGSVIELLAIRVLNGGTKSCGCLQKERTSKARRTHGMSETILYSKWLSLRNRCYTKSTSNYPRYGGRGIKVCNEWKNSFESFRDWAINNGYDEKLTIDRINFNGDYCPENCRWISAFDQAGNSRKARIMEAFGEKKHIMGWSRDPRCEVALVTLMRRLKKGMTMQEAMIK